MLRNRALKYCARFAKTPFLNHDAFIRGRKVLSYVRKGVLQGVSGGIAFATYRNWASHNLCVAIEGEIRAAEGLLAHDCFERAVDIRLLYMPLKRNRPCQMLYVSFVSDVGTVTFAY